MLFLGAFIARYRLELILSFRLVGLTTAMYFWLAFQSNSPVQNPEGLYREPWVVGRFAFCALLMGILLFVDVPLLHELFRPITPGF